MKIRNEELFVLQNMSFIEEYNNLKPFEVFGFMNQISWSQELRLHDVLMNPNLDWNFNGISHHKDLIRYADLIMENLDKNWDWYNMNPEIIEQLSTIDYEKLKSKLELWKPYLKTKKTTNNENTDLCLPQC